MKAKPVIAGVILLLVLGTVAAGVWWKRYRADTEAANQPKHAHTEFVEVVKAETTTWQPTARLVGTVIAKRYVTLANEAVGVVTEVGFNSGDTIEPGQVLLKLDIKTEQADLAAAEAAERLAQAAIEVAEATTRSAQSDLALAQSSKKRFADAATTNSVSAAEIDRVNADVDRAQAELERARASTTQAQAERDQTKSRVDQIKTTIAKKTLVAPFRARAGMRTVHPGQYLAEGTSIVSLTELTDDIYLDFAVPQEYAARVIPGMVVVASSRLLGSEKVNITVESMDATVNPNTRNIRVRSIVANPDFKLKPGMFIDVTVPVDVAGEYVTIPSTAVRRSAYGDHVFILEPAKEAPMPGLMIPKQRMIKVGADLGGRVIVQSGLTAGETIAAAGSFKLREGIGMFAAQSPPKGAPGAGGPEGAPGTGPSGAEPAAPAASNEAALSPKGDTKPN